MKVEVLRSINSGKHNKGDVVEFTDTAALRLISLGAVKAVDVPVPVSPNVKPPLRRKRKSGG